jgi:ribose 5-phosphate isomerase A
MIEKTEAEKAAELKLKEAAGRAAVDDLVKSGMKLGLGTGSTAIHAVRRVGELLKQGSLKNICAFSTSFQTDIECEKLGIHVYPLNARELSGGLDLTIDGADEVDSQNYLIKGGGGALLMEKLAAYNSNNFVIVATESKLVKCLGMGFPVPVEVIPEGRVQAACSLEKMGAEVVLREALRKAGPVITEHGNIILDVRFAAPVDPAEMEHKINRIPGVVENGFFTCKHAAIYIALADGKMEVRK